MPYGFPGVPLVQPGAGTNVPLQLPKDVLRIGEQCIWSTVRITAPALGAAVANQTFRLFSTQLGQNGQGFAPMSIAETNQKEGGRIPSGLAFDVMGIACIVQAADQAGGAAADNLSCVQTVLRHGVISWDFLQTIIDVAPCSLIGAGGGISGGITQANAGAAAAADVFYVNNGLGGLWVYRKFPVALPANSTFNVLLRFGNNAPSFPVAYDVKIGLIGAFKTAIEVG